MRNVAALLSLLVLAGIGCSADLTVRVPGTVTLNVGDRAAIQGTSWTVKFDSVVSDSRCPLGVLCIQAGEARLAFALSDPLVDPSPNDNLHFILGTDGVVAGGFAFSQVEVSPIRRQNETIDPKSYVVKIMIEGVTR